MGFMGVLIGTGILWGLTYAVAVPIARSIGEEGARQPDLPEPTGPAEALAAAPKPAKQPDVIDSVPAGTFILIHVLVMGVAGFLIGALAGVYFVGFSWKARMWPGMIAMIVASIFGAAQSGAM